MGLVDGVRVLLLVLLVLLVLLSPSPLLLSPLRVSWWAVLGSSRRYLQVLSHGIG